MIADAPERHQFEILLRLREMSFGWEATLVIDGEQTDYLGQLPSLSDALSRVESYARAAQAQGGLTIFPRLVDQFRFGLETIEPAA